MSLNVVVLEDGRRAIIIRTSDRIAFKQCRRKWGWSSHLKRNLGPKYLASPLWFGSAIHYALEDFHGYKRFANAADAFKAYCIATAKQHIRDLPTDANELYLLGTQMMDYYENQWLRYKPADQTYWEVDAEGNNIPQVEVNFAIEVPLDEHPHLKELAAAHGADAVIYRGTIDRVSIDEEGRLWIVEYKTAKRAEHMHYLTDPQVTTYVWAASHIYNRPIAGVVYHQFVKTAPLPPRVLSTGKLSTAANLVSSYPLYRQQLIDLYGDDQLAPEANRNFLATLAMGETPDRDRYIVRERIHRNAASCDSEAQLILLELEDMLNINLPLYPNPTRDCGRFCSFMSACTSMNDGSDWEAELDTDFSPRDQAADRMWRNRMPSAQVLIDMRESGQRMPSLEELQISVKGLSSVKLAEIEAGEHADDLSFSFEQQPQQG